MSGSTTELNLSTAVDADDNADYLTINLANSLRTLDGLFNNVTGHNHGGAHQGGVITPAAGSITSGMIADGTIVAADIADASITNAKLGLDVGRANLLTNGGFEVWQRGNGPFTTASAYSADRWWQPVGGSSTFSVSRDSANADGATGYCAAVTYTHNAGGDITQQIENPAFWSSKTISFSVRVKCSTATAVRARIYDGGDAFSAFHTGTGAYQTLTVTTTVRAACADLRVTLNFSASCTAYIDNACLVVGSQPANYVPLHPAEDLARCFRYFEVVYAEMAGYVNATSQVFGYHEPFKARKPIAPTITKAGTWFVNNCAQPTAILRGNSVDGVTIYSTGSAGGQVQFYSTDASCYVQAEANP